MAFRFVLGPVCALSLAALPLWGKAGEPPAALPLQVALDRAGFSPGVIDGAMGRLTRQAIKGFQGANGIAVTGNLDAKTQAALGGLPDAIESVEVTGGAPLIAGIPESMADKAKPRVGDDLCHARGGVYVCAERLSRQTAFAIQDGIPDPDVPGVAWV